MFPAFQLPANQTAVAIGAIPACARPTDRLKPLRRAMDIPPGRLREQNV